MVVVLVCRLVIWLVGWFKISKGTIISVDVRLCNFYIDQKLHTGSVCRNCNETSSVLTCTVDMGAFCMYFYCFQYCILSSVFAESALPHNDARCVPSATRTGWEANKEYQELHDTVSWHWKKCVSHHQQMFRWHCESSWADKWEGGRKICLYDSHVM